NYIGELGTGANPALKTRAKAADVVLYIGRLDEITSQEYTLLQPEQELMHIYTSRDSFGRADKPALEIETDGAPFAEALGKLKIAGEKWKNWRDEGRKEYLAWSDIKENPDAGWKGADMTEIFRQLREALPADAIITTDAGNFSGWCQRYLRYG